MSTTVDVKPSPAEMKLKNSIDATGIMRKGKSSTKFSAIDLASRDSQCRTPYMQQEKKRAYESIAQYLFNNDTDTALSMLSSLEKIMGKNHYGAFMVGKTPVSVINSAKIEDEAYMARLNEKKEMIFTPKYYEEQSLVNTTTPEVLNDIMLASAVILRPGVIKLLSRTTVGGMTEEAIDHMGDFLAFFTCQLIDCAVKSVFDFDAHKQKRIKDAALKQKNKSNKKATSDGDSQDEEEVEEVEITGMDISNVLNTHPYLARFEAGSIVPFTSTDVPFKPRPKRNPPSTIGVKRKRKSPKSSSSSSDEQVSSEEPSHTNADAATSGENKRAKTKASKSKKSPA